MPITSLLRTFVGNPNIVTIVTTDTLATITTPGYLLLPTTVASIELIQNGNFQWATTDFVLISYSGGIGFFIMDAVNNCFASDPSGGGGLSDVLASGNIFVGNASNIATGVAMSGDATIANTGAITIAANAITTPKINNAAVTLAKLAPGITPSNIIVFAGKQANGGGSATIAITVTGVLATDIAFAAVQASTTPVSIISVTPSTNTVTVVLSADPGAATTINYQVIRAAS